MMERCFQLLGVLAVAARECPADIVGDHSANRAAAIRLTEEMLRERRSHNFRYMLMFGEGLYFGLVQSAEPDAIISRYHSVVLL